MVFTFYSYKGGVGRSMALANVGEWLYRQGLRTLLIDWDLEAPGLETYFCPSAEAIDSIRNRPGVIDILRLHRRQLPYLSLPHDGADPEDVIRALTEHLPSIDTYCVKLRDEGDAARRQGSLWLLPAGLRSDGDFAGYAEAVQAFNWEELYEKYYGEQLLEWLRRSVESSFDVILIDARTGVTEMGGVCTRQLADIVVMFCAANVSNLDGTLTMATSFVRDELAAARRGRRLECVIVPARVEMGERDERNRFRDVFSKRTAAFLPRQFKSFWPLRIPYIPYYAFREELSVNAPNSIEELVEAYKNLTAHLVLLSPPESVLRKRCELEMTRVLSVHELATATSVPVDVLNQAMERQANSVLAGLTSVERNAALRALTRFVAIDEIGGPTRVARVLVSQVAHNLRALESFIEAGLLHRIDDEALREEVLELAQGFEVHCWEPLQECVGVGSLHREFLIWRQRVDVAAREWFKSGRGKNLLLSGARVEQAAAYLDARPEDLSELERQFVGASIEAAESHKREEETQAAIRREHEERAKEAVEMTRRLRMAMRRRRQVFAVVVLLLAVLGGAGYAWYLQTAESRDVARVLSRGTSLLESGVAKPIRGWTDALVLAGKHDAALQAARSIANPAERAEALGLLTKALSTAGARSLATEAAEESMRAATARRVERPGPVLARVAELLGEAQLMSLAADAATAAVNQETASAEPHVETFVAAARAFRSAGANESARKAAQQALAMALAAKDPSRRLLALSRVAEVRTQLDGEDVAKWRKAITSIPSALADPVDRADAWARVAESLSLAGLSEPSQEATDAALNALKSIPEGSDQGTRALEFARLAQAFDRMGLSESARRASHLAMEFAKDLTARASAVNSDQVRNVLHEIHDDAISSAAKVLANNLEVEEALRDVQAIRDPEKRVFTLATIAEQLTRQNRLEPASRAATAALNATVESSNGARHSCLLRTAEALLTVRRSEDAARLLAEASHESAMSAHKTPTQLSRYKSRLAGLWARAGDHARARALALEANPSDQLGAFATVLFEYWRVSNPWLADMLERM